MQRTAALAALAREYDELWALADDLSPQEWEAPSTFQGWSCRDVLAHVAYMDRSITRGAILLWALPGMDGDRTRSRTVQVWRDRPVPELRGNAEVYGRRLLQMLWVASRVGWNVRIPTSHGRRSLRSLAALRVHHLWMHNRDIALALGRPGPDVRRAAPSMLWMRSVLPHRLSPPLADDSGRDICVRVAGRVATGFSWRVGARDVEAIREEQVWVSPPRSDVQVTFDTETFVTCGAGRDDPLRALREGRIEVEGDTELGEAFLEAFPTLA